MEKNNKPQIHAILLEIVKKTVAFSYTKTLDLEFLKVNRRNEKGMRCEIEWD